MEPQLTLREVLEQLSVESTEENLLDLDTVAMRPDSPWYVRLFVGVSAWLAAIFLLGFLFMASILQSGEGTIVVGLVFCAVAVGINRAIPRNDFLGQLALALSLAGQVLLIVGLGELGKSPTEIALTLIILEGALIWLYQDRVHRFISTVVIAGAVLTVIFDFEIFELIHVYQFKKMGMRSSLRLGRGFDSESVERDWA
jgi:hypothetical protein